MEGDHLHLGGGGRDGFGRVCSYWNSRLRDGPTLTPTDNILSLSQSGWLERDC